MLQEKGFVVEKHYTPEIDQVSDEYSVSSKDKDKGKGKSEYETKSKYPMHQLH